MSRLTSDFWVSAYRMRLEAEGIPVMVVHKGDATAGAVLVKLSTLDGAAVLYQRGFAFDGPRGWEVLAEGAERVVDEAVTRQRARDPDLWVLEVEDRAGRHFLEEDGFAE